MWFTCIDDIFHLLPECVVDRLDNPDPNAAKAFLESDLDEKFMRTAARRGVSVDDLKKNQRVYYHGQKCSKSIYGKKWNTKAERLKEQDVWVKTRKVTATQTQQRREQIYADKQARLEQMKSNKEQRHSQHVETYAAIDPKELRASKFDAMTKKQLDANRDWIMPEYMK
jgi:Fe2+ transport system protein B